MARQTLQETLDRLLLLIRAGYPVIYIVSHEESRVLDYLAKIFRVIKAEQPLKHFLYWYAGVGLTEVTNLLAQPPGQGGAWPWLDLEGLPAVAAEKKQANPKADDAFNAIKGANMQNNPVLADSLTVFFDVHAYLRTDAFSGTAAPLVRPLRNTADALRRYYDQNRDKLGHRPYKTMVIVAPTAAGLSPELDRDQIVIDFPLPETEELLKTLKGLLDRKSLKFPESIPPDEVRALGGDDTNEQKYKDTLCELVAGAGRGLTLEDYKLGLNMFAVSGEPLSARHIEDMLHLKAKAINNPALQYTPHVVIELGGLNGVKEWIRLRQGPVSSSEVRKLYHLPAPKGVMLCGVSGGGKSQLAKLIAKEFNLALLRLDVGALFGSFIGESEERTRQALQLAEVLAPVVLWLDEIDKAFRGIGDGGDNGVSARVFGHFLTWLAEKQESVFVVATANDFQNLLARFPEFGRKGRFDEIFWVPLPDPKACAEIFDIYLRPHWKGYLTVSADELQTLIVRYNIPEGNIRGKDELERLCSLLGDSTVSGSMTGAEIEYAITEALYESYQQAQPGGPGMGSAFTAELLIKTVQAAKNRAMYQPGAQPQLDLARMEAIATQNGWPFAT